MGGRCAQLPRAFVPTPALALAGRWLPTEASRLLVGGLAGRLAQFGEPRSRGLVRGNKCA